jgi:hypothetical protein
MKHSTSTVGRWIASVLLAAGILFSAASAWAIDRVTLKDGRVVEGAIVEVVDGSVWIKVKSGSGEREEYFVAAQVETIERNVQSATPAEASKPEAGEPSAPAVAMASDPSSAGNTPKEQEPAIKPGVPRIAVITLGEGGDKDMVGVYMAASVLKEAIPLLEAEKVTDVVFRVNSGGGLLLEIQKLSDTIHNDYKPRFRTVAWIESAISAAAMTAHCVEEIYFMTKGNYGACTGWSGALQAMEGRDLEDALYMMERISARGKYHPLIMRAMQIEVPLSASFTEAGDVIWEETENGQHILNPKGRIFTFTADQALQFKFSKGTADTIDDLAKLMGYKEYEIVGVKKPGVSYPISKAEDRQRRFRDQVADDQKRTTEYFLTYQQSVARAQALPKEERGKFVGKARGALDQIKRMVKNNPNFALLILNTLPERFPEWVAAREKELRDLLR